MPAFSLLRPPPVLTIWLRRIAERSPTTRSSEDEHIRSFGGKLEPRYIFGAESLDQ
jgi:hypothetical protein